MLGVCISIAGAMLRPGSKRLEDVRVSRVGRFPRLVFRCFSLERCVMASALHSRFLRNNGKLGSVESQFYTRCI